MNAVRVSLSTTLGVALVSAALLFALCPRAPVPARAAGAWATAQALAHGSLEVVAAAPNAFPTVVQGARRYVAQPLGAALVLLPAALLRCERPSTQAVAGGLSASLVGGLLFALFYRRARRRGSRAAATVTTLLLAATFVTVSATRPDGEIGLALALFVFGEGVVAAVSGVIRARQALLTGVAGGAMVLCEPAAGLALLLGSLLVIAAPLVHEPASSAWRRSLLVRALFCAGGALPLTALACWHAQLIAAPPLPADFWLGLDGLLLSTGKSIFVYAPPLALLALAWRSGQDRGLLIVRLLLAAALVVVVARAPDWHGDPAWGPVRLVGIVPLLLVALVPFIEAALHARAGRWVVIVVVGVGLFVQLLGCAVRPESYLRVAEDEKNRTGAAGWFVVGADQAHFIPQLSPVVGHAWLLRHLIRHDPHLDRDPPWLLITPAPAHLEDEWPTLFIDLQAVDKDRRVRALWAALVAVELALGAALLMLARARRNRGAEEKQ